MAHSRWWIGAALAALMVVTSLGPALTLAQESGSAPATLATAEVVVDAQLHAEPAAEAAALEFLSAGTTVTLMDLPLTSPFDGQLWVQVASLQALGYLPLAVLSTAPADPEPAPLPEVIAWDTIEAPAPVACRTEPRDDATHITDLVTGQEVGQTDVPFDGWIAVICAETEGYVPAWVFESPADPVDTGAPPVAETPPVTETPAEPAPQPTESPAPPTEPAETPEAPAETPVTETPQPEPTAVPTTDANGDPVIDESFVEIAAATGSLGYVRGTDGDGVRCRSGASTSSATITVLPEGASVAVRGAASGSWQAVICAGQNGFVWADYLGNSPSSGSGSGSTGVVRGTDGDGLRCRSSAGFGGPVITILAPGASAAIRGATQGGWVPVVCAGQNGFVHADYFGAPGSGSGSSSSGGFATGQSVRVANTDGDGVRFRSSASYTGSVIAVLAEGAGLVVRSGSTGEWIAVTRGGSNGFVHRDFLVAGAGTSSGNSGTVGSSNLAAGSHARVTDFLRIRSGASFSASTLDIASTGIVVKITGAPTNGFYPVDWGGLRGYMHADYLVWTSQALSSRSAGSPSRGDAGSGSSSASGSAMAQFAQRYLGYPYVWGGRGPSSFDCAGFVYWVAINRGGINLVGGVINQWTFGRPVPYGQLQPGDVVFFQNTYQPGLSHNGIYIGNNQFVHASNPTDGVIISNLSSPYYANRWYGARRVV
jgi:cell wall-associated NlpC family hydrolase